MKKRSVRRILDVPWAGQMPTLVILAVSFLLGSLLGCGFSASVSNGGSDALTTYVLLYMKAVNSGITRLPELLPLIWETMRWPLLTMLLGFTVLGAFLIPVLFLVRGFLLSFAVAAFVRLFGTPGAGLAFILFGLTGLLSIPVLFVLGTQGFSSSLAMLGKRSAGGKGIAPYQHVIFLRCGLCTGVLALCVLLEYIAVPALLGVVAPRFVS